MMKVNSEIVIGTCAFAVVAAVVAWMVVIPATWHGSTVTFHVSLAVSMAMACLHIGAAVLFLSSLGAYKTKLRRAYAAIVATIVLIALGSVQVAVLNSFDLWQSAWVKHGGVYPPFLASGLAIYFGTRGLARLISTTTQFTKAGLVLPVIVVISGLMILAPHVSVAVPEIAYDATNVIIVVTALLDLSAALIVLSVKRHIGAHYTQAMAWLAWAILASFTILTVVMIGGLLSTSMSDIGDRLVSVLTVTAGLLWLRAGYVFSRAEEY